MLDGAHVPCIAPSGTAVPNTPVERGPTGPYHPAMETRVSRLEDDVHDMTITLNRLANTVVRIEATLNATLLTPYACGRAALAILK